MSVPTNKGPLHWARNLRRDKETVVSALFISVCTQQSTANLSVEDSLGEKKSNREMASITELH